MKLIKILSACFCFTLLLMNTQCEEDDYTPVTEFNCDETVVIDNVFYQMAGSDAYDLVYAYIDYGCLFIQVSASGCDGNSWSMTLVDSGEVAESSPEQRFLKFVFSNTEDCLAVIGKERSFSLQSLQVEGSNEIILNIEGFPEPLNYTY